MTLLVETLCLGCLAPLCIADHDVQSAIEGKVETTYACDDDLAYIGVGMDRPGERCACGSTKLIVRTRGLETDHPRTQPNGERVVKVLPRRRPSGAH